MFFPRSNTALEYRKCIYDAKMMVGPLGSKVILMRSTPTRSYTWYQAKENAKEDPKN
jgi:hypothetical protein